MNQYVVYILKCSDDSYYTGVTNNLERRLFEHEKGTDSKSYTFNRRPIELVFQDVLNDVYQAIAFEKQIKGWKRNKKEALINGDWSELVKLSNHNKGDSELIEYFKRLTIDSSMVRQAHHDNQQIQQNNNDIINSHDDTSKKKTVILSLSKDKTVSSYQVTKYQNTAFDMSTLRQAQSDNQQAHHDKSFQKVEDQLVVEESLLININYKPFTLTMRSPGNEEELVRGLLFTENIIQEGVPFNYQITEKKNGIITSVNVDIDEKHLKINVFDKRNLLSVSSCGVCGKLELNEKCDHLQPIKTGQKLKVSNLKNLFLEMGKHQKMFDKTGGSHASAAFDEKGNLLSIKEDIGRHNAVDKVIGDLLINKLLDKAIIILVSGRVSYEIVTKVYSAQIPFLAAVSSVSSLAVDLADEYGITLFGFCRNDNAVCYSNLDRLA